MEKGILYLSATLLLALFFTACEDLDRDIDTTLNERQVLESFDFTRNRLSAIYNDLPSGFSPVDGAMMASATDEAEHVLQRSNIQKFNTGSWNALDNPDDVWNHFFSGIRKVNQFLETADKVNHDIYALDPDPSQQEAYQNRLNTIKQWKNEARFLRAYFYFELVRRYGGVPIITEVFKLGDEFGHVERNSLEESIQFIIDECDEVAEQLEPVYTGENLGRVTNVAAMALKSRLLLYAASDLFNNPGWAGGYAHQELIALPAGNRVEQWKKAADAAKEVIDEFGGVLSDDYRGLFRTFDNEEIILVRRHGPSNNFEITNYSPGFYRGEGGTGPSQNLVDAYEMQDGTPFDWNNSEHSADPYSNRDPRLSMSIITNNSEYKGRNIKIWRGGLDGPGQARATRTGYYLKKYVDENIDLLENTTSVHSWILIRLAEIYLNYAEALNEYAPGHSDIEFYVDAVRGRPGVEMPPLPHGLPQSQMRERIRNERKVELAFEDHRFWDLRRWMIAPDFLGARLRGVEVERIGNSVFTYNPVVVENRVFDATKMYLYPIPQNELNKMPGLVQNPGW